MKFIILCHPRTGSTLLITALGAHPDIRQGMDIFNPEQEGDDPWVHWRKATFKKLYGEQKTYLNSQKNLDGDRFDLSLLSREFFRDFDGTKIMYDQLDRNSKVWEHLRSLEDLRVIILKRNVVEAAISFRIAMETNIWFCPNHHSYIWHVPGEKKLPPSPCLTYETWYFDWFYNYYCAGEEFFASLFREQGRMIVNYSDLVSDWDNTIRVIQIHLGVEPIEIPMMFDKRTQGTMQELISNYDEIRQYYANHPILAEQFKTAFQNSNIHSKKIFSDSTNNSNLKQSTISETFCILPFCQAVITNDGKIKLCSQTLAWNLISGGQTLSLHHMTLEQLWNSDYFRVVRTCMVKGEQIEACAKCYQIENEGGTSLRQVSNTYFQARMNVANESQLGEHIQSIINEHDGQAPAPSALHLWLGNSCNLKCRMCSPMYSSKIALDSVHSQWFDDRARSEILLPIYLDGVEYQGFSELIRRGEKITRKLIAESTSISLPMNGDRVDCIEISGHKQGHWEYCLSVTADMRELTSYWLPEGAWKISIRPDPFWCPKGQTKLSFNFLSLPRIQSLLAPNTISQSEHYPESFTSIEIENLTITIKPIADQAQPREIVSRFSENPQWFNNEAVLVNEILARPEDLRLINFSGGEPLLNPSFSLILEKLIETGHASHIFLYINSNCTKYSRYLSDLLARFKGVELAFSVDGFQNVQEYIRYPSKWKIICRNLFSFQKDNFSISIRPTIQAYNIFGVLDLARWCSEHQLPFYLNNLVWYPRFLSLDMLPQSVIDEVLPDWIDYLNTECTEENRWHVETVIAALWRSRPETGELRTLQEDFIRFTNDLDCSRGQSFALACPRLYQGLIAAGLNFDNNHRFYKPKTMTKTLTNAHVVITTCEVNSRHGTGSLVQRLVADTPQVLSLRSLNLYQENQDFGELDLCLSLHNLPREEAVKKVLQALKEHSIQAIFCVPYIPEDLILAIILHDEYQVPLAVHIMDDQNICVNAIPDELMEEFLQKCSLRLVTHPELREAYENKYGLKFWLLPAVVSESLIADSVEDLTDSLLHSPAVGALIGSLWNHNLFEELCITLTDASITLDWYNGAIDEYGKTQYFWLQDHPEKIQELGINPCGFLAEVALVETLKTYPYLVVPTGTLDNNDANPRLWRILFAVATAHIPMIILGSPTTSAAHFIQRFQLGMVCDYKGESLKQAVAKVSQPEIREQIGYNARAIAPQLSDKDINHWLWESLKLGKPKDFRFEKLLSYAPGELQPVTELSPPVMATEEVYRYFPAGISHAYAGHIVGTNNVDYVDMMSAWGSNILGYGYERVAEAVSGQMRKYANVGMVGPEWHQLQDLLIRLIPCAEAMHLVKNGSDATAAAVRLARFVTGRDIILHRGYHGVQDWYMAALHCPGVPHTHQAQIITLTSLDVENVGKILADNPNQVACLIIDPMVWPVPERETMAAIRDIVHKEGALLIFDEVVSGFRVAIGGAQEMWDVLPDLACYGKCIANGLPISVLVGRQQWMQHVSKINYGLTFSLEAVSMIAAVETLSEIVDLDVCSALAEKGRFLKQAYVKLCHNQAIASALVGHDCRPEIWFDNSNGLPADYCKNLILHELARKRVCTYGMFNLCYAHTQTDLEAVVEALECGLDKIKIAMQYPSRLEKQQLSHLQEDLTRLNDQLEQSHLVLAEAKNEIEAEKQQLSHLQEDLTRLNGQLERSHLALAEAKNEIEAMKTSKFWKLRTRWFAIKRKLGLPIT